MPHDRLIIEGHYKPFFNYKPELNNNWYRNEIIKNSNAKYNYHIISK